MRWLLLLLFLAAPGFAQDDDDDDDESSIEIESEEPDSGKEPDAPADNPAAAKKTPTAGKGDWVRRTPDKSPVSIELVDHWVLSGFKNQKSGWSCFVALPGDAGMRAILDIRILDQPDDPRGLPYNVWRGNRENETIRNVRIRSEVLPHVTYDREQADGIGVVIQTWKSCRGRTVSAALVVPPTAFESVYKTFLKASDTLEVDLPAFPVIPENYETSTKRGIVYAVHPSVTGSIRHLQSVTQATQKNFEKFHGKLPKTPRDAHPPVVFIHSSHGQAASFASGIEKETRPFVSDTTTTRFFATPVQDDDKQGSHKLATAFGHFLTMRKYGNAVPRWAYIGEINAAGVEHDTGKRLPYIFAGHSQWVAGIQLPMLNTYEPGTEETVSRICFFYVAFFHAGGSKYKKAYRAMLDDIGEHYDPAAAAKRHLEPLGYDRIQVAATKFMHGGFKIMKDR